MAVKPTSGLTLSAATKSYIKNTVLANRNVVSVTPEITDPDYLYVTVSTAIKYDSTNTDLAASSIESLISNTIYQYGVSSLGTFSNQFYL